MGSKVLNKLKGELQEEAKKIAERAAQKAKPKWDGPNPTLEERLGMTEDMLEVCRRGNKEANRYFGGNSKVEVKTKLPSDPQASVGVMTVEQLGKFKCSN